MKNNSFGAGGRKGAVKQSSPALRAGRLGRAGVNRGSSIRRIVLTRLLLELLIFTAVFFGIFIFFDIVLNGFIVNVLSELLSRKDFLSLYDLRFTIIAAIYMIVIFCFCLRTILRLIQYLDITSASLSTVILPHADVEDLPGELKQVEVILKDIKYTLASKEQMAQEAEQRKNDLVVYLAHDLKTPLTSVIGYLSLLEEAPELPAHLRAKYTSITLEKAYRLEQLINEFFDITRFNLQSLSLEDNRIDLTMMLRQMVDEFYPILSEKGLSITLHAQEGIRMVGDADKLARVLDNILRNAVNYSYRETNIDILLEQDDEATVIQVINQGDKIPPDKLEMIFHKFFRLDSARSSASGGAGLGLAIAKQIIEFHGGSIHAVSNAQNTTFFITLPIRS